MARVARPAVGPRAPKPAASRRWRAGAGPAVLLVATAWIAFASGLTAPFFMDDGEAIVRNPFITALSPLGRVFQTPPQSAVSGRPLISLSLAVNHALGGLAPVGFHALNLAVHSLAGVVLWALLRRTLRHPACRLDADTADGVALAAALLWVVHPLHSEVIAYVVQRTEAMMALCYLLTLYGAARGIADGHARWLIVAVVSCLAGALCKESIVTAPVMVLLYDVAFGAGTVVAALRRRPLFYAGLCASWLVLLALQWDGPRMRSAGLSAGISPWDYLLVQAPLLLHYLRAALWPHPLVADYGLVEPTTLAAVWPAVVVLVALAVAALALWRRHAALAFAVTWWFVTLAPSSSLVPIASEAGAERRMYLPLVAVVVLVVVAVRALLERAVPAAWRGRVAAGGTAAAVIALAATSAARAMDYRDPVGIWETVVAARPHPRAHHNLGIALAGQGRLAEAMAQYRIAAERLPEAHYSLGYAFVSQGQDAAAATELQTFLAQKPEDELAPLATNLLGMILVRRGDFAGAVDAYSRTRTMRPNDDDARRGLAQAFTGLGDRARSTRRVADAVQAFARSVEFAPEAPGAWYNYGVSLAEAGRPAEAEQALRQGLALAPDHEALRSTLAELTASRRP